MDDVRTAVDLGVDERRLVIEILATLAHLKQNMIALILQPADVPREVYQPLLNRRDERTGWAISKRQFAAILIEELDKRPDGRMCLRRMIKIAAEWHGYHVAEREYEARATVQKAREILGAIDPIDLMEARAAQVRDLAKQEELARLEEEERQRARVEREELRRGLLMQFDSMSGEDHQRRGYLLQDLLGRVFDLCKIPVVKPFSRNDGGEQVDGGFKFEGWHYIVECRWRERLADIRQLDGLLGQVERSGRQTMGMFLSIEGWSENVVP